ncbi:MAG: ABC transporter substrate-binding protein [Halioglobus sp.]|nr:ABC transporter substrate-binding protein [Halioglobus sp.]
MDTRRLPACEKSELQLGYLRLTDSAPVIMAKELGLYASYGLDVTLQREVSWANLRDKLTTGHLDAAQILAPLPLATALGAGGMRAEVITGLALSLNGNAITVSPALAGHIEQRGGNAAASAASTAKALGQWLREAGGSAQLTFASAHSFSCHTFLLRLWLQAGGIDPERDVRIIVLPPEQMVDSLARGIIDGYCVGEPWNSMSVQRGVGAVQATGYQIWNNGIEKVLGVLQGWHQNYPTTHLRLRLALMEACAWLAQPANREETAAVLARPEFLDCRSDYLLPSLTGKFVFARGGKPLELPDFHVFGRYQAGFPWRSDGEWLLQQTGALLGKDLSQEKVKALVQQTYRTDLYREAARHLGIASPGRDYKPFNQHSAPWEFEPGIQLGPDQLLSP